MSETMAETAKRLEGAPNTAPRMDKCELRFVGKHICGGSVTLTWGRSLCAVAALMFLDHHHHEIPRALEAWMRSKGWTP